MRIVTAAPIEKLCWQPDGAAGVRRHVLLADAGRYFRHRPAAVDASELEPWASEYPPLRDNSVQFLRQVVCYELRDACVTSQGIIITRDGHAVRETFGTLFEVEGLKVHGMRPLDDRQERFEQDAEPTRRTEGPALLLKAPWWANFFHWLLEAAARLALLRQRGGLRPEMRIVTGPFRDPTMVANVAATLRALWPWPDPVVLEHDDHEMAEYECLYYVTPVHPGYAQVPATLSAMRRFMVPPPGPRGPRRIFIERSGMMRELTNVAEVRALCLSYGCEPVHPVRYPLLEQVRLFRDAELIVGVKGADFANGIFCSPWANLLLISPGDFADPTFWDIAAHGPLNYFELFGGLTDVVDITGRNPFSAPIEGLRRFLDIACTAPGPGSPRNRLRYSGERWLEAGYMPWLDRPVGAEVAANGSSG